MDPIGFIIFLGILSSFVIVPLVWVIIRGKRSGDPEDAHIDYRVKDDTKLINTRLSRVSGSGVYTEWFKILNEKDLRYLITSSPVRLSIVYWLLNGPSTYKALFTKVKESLEDNFKLKISEQSYDWHFDWLVDSMVINKEGDYYRLTPIPSDILNIVIKKFKTKMKA